MRIATWNINSVRLRLPLVQEFLTVHAPDILCLQETKCPDSAFPIAEFAALGYAHAQIRGEKSYNGVAIISKLPLGDKNYRLWAGRDDTRHVSATIANDNLGDVSIHNFYVPAGGDIPDPDSNAKFAHKLNFMEEMASWFCTHAHPSPRMILLGDLNVAPTPYDVWSHQQLLNIVSYTAIEREKLEAVQASCEWVDIVRQMHPATQKLYSWWSYRAQDWAQSNRGRRLDHIWLTPSLRERAHSCEIATHWRAVARPSDHVPVILDISL